MYAVFELYIKDDELHDDVIDVAVVDTDTRKIVRYNLLKIMNESKKMTILLERGEC